MKGELFVIIGTPESRRKLTLRQGISKEEGNDLSHFLFPKEIQTDDLPGSNWQWTDGQFEFNTLDYQEIKEWFLFLSNNLDLADQIEAIISLLGQNSGLTIARIITFINSDVLFDLNDNLQNWLDACAHFSDVFCFSNRKNDNSKLIKQVIDRYASLHYPLETYILAAKKVPAINSILSSIPKRITHVFDSPEILDPEDQPENDPFLIKQPNGKRKNLTLNPFKN